MHVCLVCRSIVVCRTVMLLLLCHTRRSTCTHPHKQELHEAGYAKRGEYAERVSVCERSECSSVSVCVTDNRCDAGLMCVMAGCNISGS
jgi:hypothetical protein